MGKSVVKIINIFVLLISCVYSAQNFRVFYDYKFKLDSLNRDDMQAETMILEIDKNNSYFYSYPKLISDSTIQSRFKIRNGNMDFTDVKNSEKVHFSVSKDLKNQITLLHQYIGQDRITLPIEKIKWEISNINKEIKGIKTYKATTKFMGRNWVAWYSEDYPIQEGAFVFSGLPGLILEVYDDRFDHYFTLLGIKKTNPKTDYKMKHKSYGDINLTEVKQFRKLWESYKKDPAKSFRTSQSNSSIQTSISVDGVSDINEIIKNIENQAKARLEKENNHILLDLYK